MLKKDSDLLICANCGRRIRWDDSFCPACGSKIQSTENSSINIPRLSETVGKLELWGRTSEETPKADVAPPAASTPSRKTDKEEESAQETDKPKKSSRKTNNQASESSGPKIIVRFLDRRWRAAWLKRYHISPKRECVLLGLVLAELFMFFPYVFMVICAFQYNFLCAVLSISSAAVLLTHGVCVCVSYVSIFVLEGKHELIEATKAADETHWLLKLGATFASIFLLAFFVGLSYNDVVASTGYAPVSFDN